MILVPCIHFRMYIGTRAENENSDYCYFIYTVMKVLLNIYVYCSILSMYIVLFLRNFLLDFVFIILIITLSILVIAIFRAQTEISIDKSAFLTLTMVVRATGLGALASDKLYN